MIGDELIGQRTWDVLVALGETLPDAMPGHVYFIQGVDGGPIKIGYTAVRSRIAPAASRLASLQAGSPVVLVARASWPSTPDVERYIHKVFRSDRLHGEWFSESAELSAVIDALSDPVVFQGWIDEVLDDLLDEAMDAAEVMS